MKKAMYFLGCALFVAAMSVSCGGNNNENDSINDSNTTVDSMPVDSIAQDSILVEDTIPVEQTATTTKKTTTEKKAQTTEERLSSNASGRGSNNGSMTLKKTDGTKTTSKNDLNPTDATIQKTDENKKSSLDQHHGRR
ncbi:MAG: hypothetical protein J6X59_01345 [Bacteroidales bacterium]|nr:hypothetical protein [Bacteroidales bacterium]